MVTDSWQIIIFESQHFLLHRNMNSDILKIFQLFSIHVFGNLIGAYKVSVNHTLTSKTSSWRFHNYQSSNVVIFTKYKDFKFYEENPLKSEF